MSLASRGFPESTKSSTAEYLHDQVALLVGQRRPGRDQLVRVPVDPCPGLRVDLINCRHWSHRPRVLVQPWSHRAGFRRVIRPGPGHRTLPQDLTSWTSSLTSAAENLG